MYLDWVVLIAYSDVYAAMIVVVILLVVLSIPSILLTVRGSSKLLKRYRLLRCIGIENTSNIPKMILDEWTVVNSPLTYASMLSEEIERLNALRPAVLQAEIAAVLIIVLAIVPGFETNVLIGMIVVLAAIILSILYSRMNTRDYAKEYVMVMAELESNGDEHHDMIYA